jgi:hypothetical protein
MKDPHFPLIFGSGIKFSIKENDPIQLSGASPAQSPAESEKTLDPIMEKLREQGQQWQAKNLWLPKPQHLNGPYEPKNKYVYKYTQNNPGSDKCEGN